MDSLGRDLQDFASVHALNSPKPIPKRFRYTIDTIQWCNNSRSMFYTHSIHTKYKTQLFPSIQYQNPRYPPYYALRNYWHNINQLHIQFPISYMNFVPTSNILNNIDPKTITHVKQLNRITKAPLTWIECSIIAKTEPPLIPKPFWLQPLHLKTQFTLPNPCSSQRPIPMTFHS